MSWTSEAVEQLAACQHWGYRGGSPGASEPTALAALALLGNQRQEAATRALDWLAATQNRDGGVGVGAEQAAPAWTTSLAVLAWSAANKSLAESEPGYRRSTDRAIAWLLNAEGVALPRTSELGHDSTIVGWPWVLGTHSWLEPTAWAVLALEATGNSANRRARDGVRMLVDRLLPTGGANYGNTYVLGQKLRPQIEPTGLALLALAAERDVLGRIEASCKYLLSAVSADTPAISLSYALLGLAAHQQLPASATMWLSAAYDRTVAQGNSPLKLALLTLAALGPDGPLVAVSRQRQENP